MGEWIPDSDEDGGEGGCISAVAVLCFAAAILWACWKAGASWGWW